MTRTETAEITVEEITHHGCNSKGIHVENVPIGLPAEQGHAADKNVPLGLPAEPEAKSAQGGPGEEKYGWASCCVQTREAAVAEYERLRMRSMCMTTAQMNVLLGQVQTAQSQVCIGQQQMRTMTVHHAAEMAKAEAANAELQSGLRSAQTELKTVCETVESLRSKAAQLIIEADIRKAEIQRLEKENAAKQAEAERVAREMLSSVERDRAAAAEMAELKGQVRKLQGDLKNARLDLEEERQLRYAAIIAEEDAERLRFKMADDALKRERDMNNSMQSLRGEIKRTQEEAAALRKRGDDYLTSLDASNAECKVVAAKLAATEAKQKDLESCLELERSKVNAYFKVYGFHRVQPRMDSGGAEDILGFINRELDELVGQEGVKKQIRSFYHRLIIARAKRQLLAAQSPQSSQSSQTSKDSKDAPTNSTDAKGDESHSGGGFCGHLMLTGKPGCGKTTIALLLQKILLKLGLVNSNFNYVHGNNLTAQFVGWTKEKVHAEVGKAKGGVFICEEAYSLLNSKDNFGKEAADALLEHLLKPESRPTCVFIFLGYADKMRELLTLNDGLQRRIHHKFDFQRYSNAEIAEMVVRKLAKRKESVVADPTDPKKDDAEYARSVVVKALDAIIPQAVDKENAALCDRLIEALETARAERLAENPKALERDPELANRLTALDFEHAVQHVNDHYRPDTSRST